MSQSRQVKGRRKEGKGMHGSVGNNFWVGFKKEWLECENEECKVWVSMRVPDGWKGGEDRFKCGLCVMKDVVEVRNENLKRHHTLAALKRYFPASLVAPLPSSEQISLPQIILTQSRRQNTSITTMPPL